MDGWSEMHFSGRLQLQIDLPWELQTRGRERHLAQKLYGHKSPGNNCSSNEKNGPSSRNSNLYMTHTIHTHSFFSGFFPIWSGETNLCMWNNLSAATEFRKSSGNGKIHGLRLMRTLCHQAWISWFLQRTSTHSPPESLSGCHRAILHCTVGGNQGLFFWKAGIVHRNVI